MKEFFPDKMQNSDMRRKLNDLADAIKIFALIHVLELAAIALIVILK